MQPRDWLDEDDRGSFGRKARVEWRPAKGVNQLAEQQAAQAQHERSLLFRTARRAQGLSQRDVAAVLGRSEDTLGRKLRGEDWARLADLCEWALALDEPGLGPGSTNGS